MNEKIIHLENIDLVVLFGLNNKKLDKIKEHFPHLKLVSRGSHLKVLGPKDQIIYFEKIYD